MLRDTRLTFLIIDRWIPLLLNRLLKQEGLMDSWYLATL